MRSTIIIWRIIPGGWLITIITANHSNYLVCDRTNTQSVTVRKVVKLQLNYCLRPHSSKVNTISSCSGGERGMFILHHFNWCLYTLFSDVSLRRQASMTQAEKFPRTFLLKGDVSLFNHLVRKADVAGCCSAGSVLRWHEVAPYSVSRLYCLKLFFTLSWCRSINTIPAS